MQEQAQNLTHAVSVFKLAPTAYAASAPAASPPTAQVRQLTPRAQAKPQAPTRVAGKTAPAQAKTGTDDEWSEF
jgi:methyl-accepting chemotaxis protein